MYTLSYCHHADWTDLLAVAECLGQYPTWSEVQHVMNCDATTLLDHNMNVVTFTITKAGEAEPRYVSYEMDRSSKRITTHYNKSTRDYDVDFQFGQDH